ncbi:dihydrofolate reductase family protein [soil metagenome]
MRTLISAAHISLDGFMATLEGDMSFLSFDEELADHTYPLMKTVDTSVYGRFTYQMMDGYWPAVADAPDSTAHEKSHARWYMGVNKIVASRTITSTDPKVHVVGDDIVAALRAEKQQEGGDIMIFGSPTLMRTLSAAGIVDEWRLSLQPVALGAGLPLFDARANLQLRSSKTFRSGVIAAHYVTKR